MADQPSTNDNISLHRREKAHVKRYTCLTAFVALLLVLCLLVMGGTWWVRQEIVSGLTPEEIADLEKAQTEIVRLPPEWHQPAKLVPERIQRLHDDYENVFYPIIKRYDRLLTGSGDDATTRPLFGRMGYALPVMDDDQRTTYAQLLAELQPFMDEVTSVTQDADYSMQSELKAPQFLAFQTFAKFMSVKAREEASRGDYAAAVETLAVPLRMVRRPEQSWLITHLIGIAIGNISANAMNQVLQQTSDTVVLHRALDVLTESEKYVLAIGPENFEFSENFSQLRIAAALGAPVDIGPQTRASMDYQMRWIFSLQYYRWLVDNLPAGDYRADFARSQLANYTAGSSSGSSSPWYKLDLGEMMADMINNSKDPLPTTHATGMLRLVNGLLDMDMFILKFMGFKPNYIEATTRLRMAQAYFDLLRLNIAQRLAELESGVTPQESSRVEHLRAYLGTVPDDPFTSAPYLLTAGKRFYSPGPDKVDDKNAFLYDATNGTLSTGDVDFAPLRDPAR